jgi:hypothetical protein
MVSLLFFVGYKTHQLLVAASFLYTYEFWLSLCKIIRSSVILLLPLFTVYLVPTKYIKVPVILWKFPRQLNRVLMKLLPIIDVFYNQKKINILFLVLSEKKFLNETKNHNPPPLQVKWSVPNKSLWKIFDSDKKR